MGANWIIRESDPSLSESLASKLSISKALSSILVARGLSDVEQARSFLLSRLNNLHDPFLFHDMEKATHRILQAVMKREKMLIYGDYDVDGISATALLYSLLRMVDAEASYFIPDRLKEGYGMKPQQVEEAARDGVKLLITVDTGISSIEEIQLANSLGMDVIVTDHHEPPAKTLPPAHAIINPKRDDSSYPFRNLAGVGVAFKLAWAVAQSFSPTRRVSDEFRSFLMDALALVALGTVADVVPLVDENRVFVHFGLKALENTTKPGLRALLEKTGLAGRTLKASDIAFKIAPRLNAAGRMGRSNLGMDLFTTKATRDADLIAEELERENRNRQKIEGEIFKNTLKNMVTEEDLDDKIVVLAQDGWHSGVTGIVAAKLADTLSRPVVLIAVNGDRGRGSARSLPNVHIYELLQSCSDYLIGFGGHAAAAGFEILVKDIENFKSRVTQKAKSMVSTEALSRQLNVDAHISLQNLTVHSVRDLERLRPHGEGNPEPLFLSREISIAGKPHAIGRDGKHLAVQFRTNDFMFRAVGFGMSKVIDKLDSVDKVSIVFVPTINSWRGCDTVELELRDIATNGKSLVYDDE